MKIAVLGASGMLGSQVLRTLEVGQQHQLVATCRSGSTPVSIDPTSTVLVELDAETISAREIAALIGDCDWWINCIGLIKPFINDTNPSEVARAITVNSLFPAFLAQAAETSNTKVIQIATDCVWNGADGGYSEIAPHNATDVYGKSKSLGEVNAASMFSIRCSIIGREIRNHVSLLDWFLGQDKGAALNGYGNHLWNGVTTLQFARVCKGIIEQNMSLKPLQHLVPEDSVSKYELLKLFAACFDRQDITITAFDPEVAIDRTLSTVDPAHNAQLWQCGGYDQPPSIEDSVAELAKACAS